MKVGLLRMTTAVCAASLAIYVEPATTSVAVASVLGFMAGYFTRIRDNVKGK